MANVAGGKGCATRPSNVPMAVVDANWELAFGKKAPKVKPILIARDHYSELAKAATASNEADDLFNKIKANPGFEIVETYEPGVVPKNVSEAYLWMSKL